METIYVLWVGGEPLILSDTPQPGFEEEEVNPYFLDEALGIDPALDLIGYFHTPEALPDWGCPEWEGEGYYVLDKSTPDQSMILHWRTAVQARLDDIEEQLEKVAYRLAHPLEWALCLEAHGWVEMDQVWDARRYLSRIFLEGHMMNPHKAQEQFYEFLKPYDIPELLDPQKNRSLYENHHRYFKDSEGL